MLRISTIEEPDSGETQESVRLDYDRRSRRRMVFTTAAGREILLDEHRPVHLRDGAILRLSDGGAVRVEAEDEELLEIAASSSAELVRIAWHLGNRHLPTQLLPGPQGGAIRIRRDHVIAAMAEGLGGTVRHLLAPFDPEGGAYAQGAAHHHPGHDHHDHHRHDPHRHEHADG